MSINPAGKHALYAYMRGVLENKGCHVHALNGVADHIHILFDLPGTRAVSDVVRDLKRSSSLWLSGRRREFPIFSGWASEFAAFSCSVSSLDDVVKYILNQERHHQSTRFDAEYAALMARVKAYDERCGRGDATTLRPGV